MKTKTIQIRITETEKKAIKKKADDKNMTLSEYLRFIALNGEVK
jgi:predicted DNA binding CopG/RHH family protein